MKQTVIKGSVQVVAKRDNRDAMFVREFVGNPAWPILLTGVADGISQCPYGGAVARWFCQYMAERPLPISTPETLAADIVRLIGKARETFTTEFQQSEDFTRSCCTLALCAISGNTLHGFWAGDSPIMLTTQAGDSCITEVLTKRDVDEFGHLTDHFGAGGPHSVKTVSMALHAGDTVTLASDGFAQIWDPGSLSGVYADSRGSGAHAPAVRRCRQTGPKQFLPVARVAPSTGETLTVQFLVDDTPANSEIMAAVRQELEFMLEQVPPSAPSWSSKSSVSRSRTTHLLWQSESDDRRFNGSQ